MMRRDRWDEKGRSQDAINISGWKKGAGGINTEAQAGGEKWSTLSFHSPAL